MEFNWWVGHLFGGLRNKFVLNVHSLKIWVVHQLVYSAPSLQVEHCIGFAGEHLTELYIYIYLTIILRGRARYQMIDNQLGATRLVGYNHLISSKPE